VRKAVELLDVPVAAPPATTLRVVSLKHAKAQHVANTLQNLANQAADHWSEGPKGRARLVITVDDRTNALVIVATNKAMGAVTTLIDQLDVDVEAKEPPPGPPMASVVAPGAPRGLDTLISLDVHDMRVEDLLEQLALSKGLGLVVAEDMRPAGTVTLTVNAVPLRDVLAMLARARKLSWSQEAGGTVQVKLAAATK